MTSTRYRNVTGTAQVTGTKSKDGNMRETVKVMLTRTRTGNGTVNCDCDGDGN